MNSTLNRVQWGCCAMLMLAMNLAAPARAESDEAAHQQFVFAYRLMERGDEAGAAQAFDDFLSKFPQADKRGDALYYRALLARKTGQAQLAVKLLQDAPAPKFIPVHAVQLLRGQVLIDLGMHQEAIAALEQVQTQELPPAMQAPVLYLRGLAYRGAKNYGAAQKQLAAAAALPSPLKSRILLDLGRVQGLLQDQEQAMESLKQAIAASDPQVTPEACRLAGDLAYRMGRHADALDFYRRVANEFQASPHFGASTVGLMWSHLALKQYPQVIDAYAKYSRSLKAGDQAMSQFLAATVHQIENRPAEAVPLFQAMLAAAANTGYEDQALLKLATAQFELRQSEDMKRTLDTLRQRYPKSKLLGDAEFLQATAEANGGDHASALQRLSAIVEQGPKHPQYIRALLQRARLYESASQPGPAAADLQTFLSLAASQPAIATAAELHAATLNLIALNYALGEYAKVDELAAKLLETPKLDPSLRVEARYRQILAQVKLQKLEQALQSIETVGREQPGHPYTEELRYYRGMVLVTLKRADEAEPDLQAAGQSTKLPATLKANALRMLSLQLQAKNDSKRSAESLLALASVQGGLSREDQLFLSRHFVGLGDAKRAMDFITPLLQAKQELEPRMLAELYFLSGQCQRGLGDPAAALASFQEVVRLGRGFEAAAGLEAARSLEQMGQLPQAVERYNELINERDSRIAASALYESAVLYRRLAAERRRASDSRGEADANAAAGQALKRLVLLYSFPKLSPIPELSFLELAELADDLGDAKAAKEEYQALAKAYPDTPYAQYANAMLALKVQQKSEALSRLRSLRDVALDARLTARVLRQIRTLEER